MFNIKIDEAAIGAEIKKLVANTDAAGKEAVGAATQSLHATSKNELTRAVYNHDIPTNAEVYDEKLRRLGKKRVRPKRPSKPAYRRKMRAGGLLGAETYAISTDGKTGRVFTEPGAAGGKAIKNWPGGYSEKVHESRKRPKNWRTRAVQSGRSSAISKARAAYAQRLNR